MAHPSVNQAIEEIDAAVFSSDTFFNKEDRENFLYYLKRWQKEVENINYDEYASDEDEFGDK